jgi:carbonic anhydrase/acetyltransferase-like protein (isoleucine patch superfamily)
VTLAEGASAWYGATLRADRAAIRVGKGSAVLDNALVSTTSAGGPVSLGADVTVCAGAHVQSAKLGDGAMVGAGAQVLAGATVGADAYIDAGAVVAAGVSVPSGQLWTGAPARFLRALEADEMSFLRSAALRTAALAQTHAAQGALSVAAVEAQAEERLVRLENSIPAEAPLAKVDADVVQYYKLTAPKENSGLLRSAELNVAEELRLREEFELAADTAEELYFNEQARLRRIGEAVRLLGETRADQPADAAQVLGELAARDPEGAAQLRTLIARAATAAAPGDKEELLRSVAATDFAPHATPEEAKGAHEAALAALAAHARALGSAVKIGGGASA